MILRKITTQATLCGSLGRGREQLLFFEKGNRVEYLP